MGTIVAILYPNPVLERMGDHTAEAAGTRAEERVDERAEVEARWGAAMAAAAWANGRQGRSARFA